MLYIFGDSFAQDYDYKNFTPWFKKLSSDLNIEYENYGLQGSGPEYSMIKFRSIENKLNDDFVVMMLSDPQRDYHSEDNPMSLKNLMLTVDNQNTQINLNNQLNCRDDNIKNILYLKYMAKHFYKNTKFFVNVIWKNHIVNSQFIMSEDNFYYCDCDLGSIWLEEYEMDVMYNVPFGKNTLMKNGKVEAIIEDNRYNHMSQRTHDTLSNLIYDFFVNQKMPKNTNNMFEKRFLKITDEHLRVIQEKEFVYE